MSSACGRPCRRARRRGTPRSDRSHGDRSGAGAGLAGRARSSRHGRRSESSLAPRQPNRWMPAALMGLAATVIVAVGVPAVYRAGRRRIRSAPARLRASIAPSRPTRRCRATRSSCAGSRARRARATPVRVTTEDLEVLTTAAELTAPELTVPRDALAPARLRRPRPVAGRHVGSRRRNRVVADVRRQSAMRAYTAERKRVMSRSTKWGAVLLDARNRDRCRWRRRRTNFSCCQGSSTPGCSRSAKVRSRTTTRRSTTSPARRRRAC